MYRICACKIVYSVDKLSRRNSSVPIRKTILWNDVRDKFDFTAVITLYLQYIYIYICMYIYFIFYFSVKNVVAPSFKWITMTVAATQSIRQLIYDIYEWLVIFRTTFLTIRYYSYPMTKKKTVKLKTLWFSDMVLTTSIIY